MDPQNKQEENSPTDSHILPKAQERRKPVFDPTGKVEQITSDEIRVADVRRHPFGLFVIYLQAIVGLSIAFLLIFLLMPGFLDTIGVSQAQGNSLLFLAILISVILGLGFLFLAARIYRGNQLIVTNENVTQVAQVGLFHRKVSELSMHNVEDVTSAQRGIIQTFFNFGTLTIETAGEQNNFIFVYCPNPNAYAKAILDARQDYFKRHSGIDQ
jgi:uncharacterized membrane protein YdbT with pleckstrin-like domain